MLLWDVLYKVSIRSVAGSTDVQVEGITIDSREVKKDFVFVAVKGAGADGHQFIDKAIINGAIAIVCEELPPRIE